MIAGPIRIMHQRKITLVGTFKKCGRYKKNITNPKIIKQHKLINFWII